MNHFPIRSVSVSAWRRRKARRALFLPFAVVLGAMAFPGCSRGSSESKTAAASSGASAATPTYDLKGEVVGFGAARRTLLVRHEEIPNYMPAMTMEFKVVGAEAASFKEGQKIAAKMIDEKNGEFRLEGIRVLDPAKDAIVAEAARALKEDTFVRGKGAYREIGEVAPRFSLYDQEGNVLTFDHLRGKRVILNFIYTRCPIATMCPAATLRMAALQRSARERGFTDLHLVSISLDPTHDTPAVLKAYAQGYGIDPKNFSFLTGPEDAVRSLMVQFGVLLDTSENLWKHTLSTLLISHEGRIVHRVDGSTWETEEFLKRL